MFHVFVLCAQNCRRALPHHGPRGNPTSGPALDPARPLPRHQAMPGSRFWSGRGPGSGAHPHRSGHPVCPAQRCPKTRPPPGPGNLPRLGPQTWLWPGPRSESETGTSCGATNLNGSHKFFQTNRIQNVKKNPETRGTQTSETVTKLPRGASWSDVTSNPVSYRSSSQAYSCASVFIRTRGCPRRARHVRRVSLVTAPPRTA